MTRVKRFLIALFIIIVAASGSYASQLVVDNLTVSGMQWGPQKVSLKLTNNYPDYKFIVAEAEVVFSGQSQKTNRYFKGNFIVEPLKDTALEIPVNIPGGFGSGKVQISIYNVVDTLDRLLPSQIEYSGEIALMTEIPESVAGLVETGLQAPIFVDQGSVFDILFHRVMLLLLHRGKSIREIADICNTDPAFVKQTVASLKDLGYIRQVDNKYLPAFAVIDVDKVAPLEELAGSAADEMYKIISGNMAAYTQKLDELIKAEKVTADPNDVLDGSSILHHLHPTVTALFMWDKVGKEFINDGRRFSGYKSLGLCNVRIGEFMHLVVADSSKNVNTFYFYNNDPHGRRLVCGVADSYVKCDPRFNSAYKATVNSLFDHEHQPLYYTYDAAKCRAALDALGTGSGAYLNALKEQFGGILGDTGGEKVMKSARYWLWSLVVDKVIDKVEKNGLADREANVYIFQIMDS